MPDTLEEKYEKASRSKTEALFSLTEAEHASVAALIERHKRTPATTSEPLPSTASYLGEINSADATHKWRLFFMAGNYYLIDSKHAERCVGIGQSSVYYAVEYSNLTNADEATILYTLKIKPDEPRTRHFLAREIDAHALLGRPFIHDCDTRTKPHSLYQVTPYIPGDDLLNFYNTVVAAEGKYLTPLQTAHIVHAIAKALTDFHEQGLVHRDIKFENLVIRYNNDLTEISVDIIDLEYWIKKGTNDRCRVGSHTYTPVQEQESKKRSSTLIYTGQYDIYAFSILASLLYGKESRQPRFDRVDASLALTAKIPILQERADGLSVFDGTYRNIARNLPLNFDGLPEPVRDFLVDCGSEIPDKRPNSAEAVAFFAEQLQEAEAAAERDAARTAASAGVITQPAAFYPEERSVRAGGKPVCPAPPAPAI